MADYEEILDTQIEPDAPLTAVLAAQWRDNPLAMFEGAEDAPRLAWKTIAASGSTVTITSLSQFGGAYCVIPAHFVASEFVTADITIEIDTGSGFSSPQAAFEVVGPVDRRETVVVFVDFLSGNWRSAAAGANDSGNFSGVNNNVTGLRFTLGGTGVASMGVMATLQGGDSAV